jgi:hypothetical protein
VYNCSSTRDRAGLFYVNFLSFGMDSLKHPSLVMGLPLWINSTHADISTAFPLHHTIQEFFSKTAKERKISVRIAGLRAEILIRNLQNRK